MLKSQPLVPQNVLAQTVPNLYLWTLQWYTCYTHSVKTIVQILNFNLFVS